MIINNESDNIDPLDYVRNGRGCVRGKFKIQESLSVLLLFEKKYFLKSGFN